jgi:hypothetical protein
VRLLPFYLLSAALMAQEPGAVRSNPALAPVQDDPALPRVLLIGDSISIGYTLPVRQMLAGKANVHRPSTNCGPSINGYVNLSRWLGADKWDVIHFNFGLHDLKQVGGGSRQVPLDQYERNLTEIAGKLKATNAKLIWASTTPVPSGELSPPRVPEDVTAYNDVAMRIMRANGIVVDDLYALALPRLGALQLKNNVHFTPEGYEALARQVADSVSKALEK